MSTDPDDAITLLIEIHANEGQEQEARDALLHAIATSAKPGMISSRQFADSHDPGAFFAIQEWESEEAFHAHMEDAAKSGMSEAVKVLSRAPRTTVLRGIANGR
ncbi:antibiotic biosynthesis monooxygenase family protein [Streptomyces coelicoflavus]|uniref:putative quinol monooxygenase n=1 Tax=Streptomyces coelicoflavus TaxID=285562 RepID=UPI002E26251A